MLKVDQMEYVTLPLWTLWKILLAHDPSALELKPGSVGAKLNLLFYEMWGGLLLS